ncbi:MAG: NAD-dependent epimerase/dehydratase family protein [Bradyrhizobium sp.]|nr:NAD-dependent epimerase/dehydratase family protein [Bradyrhizobium sp.]
MPHIAVLGANGLIGNALALDLQRRGFEVIGHARQFTAAQRTALTGAFAETPLLSLSQGDLAKLLENADMVVNTIGSGRWRPCHWIYRHGKEHRPSLPSPFPISARRWDVSPHAGVAAGKPGV